LKILALHGKDQNMVIFKKRLKASFKSKLKSVAEIVAVDALHLRHLEEKGRSREWAQIRGTDVTGATAHDSMLLEKDDPYSFKDREQVRFVSGRCPLLMLNGTPLPEGRYFVRPQSHRARESFVDLYKDEALEVEVSLAAGQAARDLGSWSGFQKSGGFGTIYSTSTRMSQLVGRPRSKLLTWVSRPACICSSTYGGIPLWSAMMVITHPLTGFSVSAPVVLWPPYSPIGCAIVSLLSRVS